MSGVPPKTRHFGPFIRLEPATDIDGTCVVDLYIHGFRLERLMLADPQAQRLAERLERALINGHAAQLNQLRDLLNAHDERAAYCHVLSWVIRQLRELS